MQLRSLTGLRFLAALLVVVHHTSRDLAQIPILTDALTAGTVGVGFFFALSGFILTWSASPTTTKGAFYRRRFARVYPLHFATWLISIPVLLWLGQEMGTVELVAGLLLLQAWVPAQQVYFGMNAPSWSLSVEAFFYALFPFLNARVSAVRVQLWHLGAVIAVMGTLALAVFLLAGTKQWIVYIFPGFRLLEFISGILLAVLIRQGFRVRVSLSAALLISVAMFAVAAGPVQWTVGHQHGISNTIMLPAWLLLISAAATENLAGRSGWVGNKVMVRLGEWSFALYLTHWLLLQAWAFVDPAANERPVVWRILEDGLFVIVAVAISAVLYTTIEKPLERQLRGRRTPRPEIPGDSTALRQNL